MYFGFSDFNFKNNFLHFKNQLKHSTFFLIKTHGFYILAKRITNLEIASISMSKSISRDK